MDEKRYWAFRVRSSPDTIKLRIAQFVEQNNLRERIPSMYCEKTTVQRGIREFYFFLNIECDDDDIPYDVLHRPELQNIARPIEEQPFTYDQIKSMTSREVDLESIKYARRIGYRPPEIVHPDNPFDFAIASELNDTAQESNNYLLYWMSAVGKGTWQTFREACRSLRLSTNTEARHIFRRFRLLGHVEYLNSGSHWTICPPCLVKVSERQGSRYFLSGAQVPVLIREIQDFGNVKVEVESNHGGPESVFLKFNSDTDVQELLTVLREMYTHFRDAGPAGTKLADVLPELNGWYRDILSPIGVASDRYWLEKWNGEDFVASVAEPLGEGMYRLKSLEKRDQELYYYYYFAPERNQWLQGDWYGLRFLANYHLGIQAELTYEPTLEQLFVPKRYHLPDLYERTLVLAAGKLPSVVPGGLVYETINPPLAETIRTKLYAQLIKGR